MFLVPFRRATLLSTAACHETEKEFLLGVRRDKDDVPVNFWRHRRILPEN